MSKKCWILLFIRHGDEVTIVKLIYSYITTVCKNKELHDPDVIAYVAALSAMWRWSPTAMVWMMNFALCDFGCEHLQT